jgi:hypothetical protein
MAVLDAAAKESEGQKPPPIEGELVTQLSRQIAASFAPDEPTANPTELGVQLRASLTQSVPRKWVIMMLQSRETKKEWRESEKTPETQCTILYPL